MTTMMMPLLAFLFGSALVAAAAYALMPARAVAIDRRLEELTDPKPVGDFMFSRS